ncbi:hypothetical protein [Anaerosacchariphilus polymeriproducens]|uniref:Uncharacterized protein n=1 Tax=Anaerosacchariphilus polymeriproducens TaxID=1812858 RepID=A0A371AZS0_9FIRM|nr:hypothetical protein [Anaerosacchariphilus polymeriproducens]RDU24980.1 hypothetical protein DWV06_01765 [Anaerosacchariphilus polymeriproducens]
MTSHEEFKIDKLNEFMNRLDEKSRKIVWYFRYHGYARLSELTKLIGASADMEVLDKLREVINPVSVEIFGKPILEFRKSGVDRITGKIVPFHWWLSDDTEENQFFLGGRGKPLVDIFEEEEQLIIISEISPTISYCDKVKVEQRHGILQITLNRLN